MSDIDKLKAEIDKLETKINTCEDDKLRIMLFAEYNRLEGELSLTNKLNRKRITEDEFYDALDALDVEKKQEIDREMKKWETESKKRDAEMEADSGSVAGSPERKRDKKMSVIDVCKEYDFQECKVEEIGKSGLGVIIWEIKSDDYSRIIYDRQCYEEYYSKIIDDSLKGVVVVTGTPGTGKTTMLFAFLVRLVVNQLTGILRVGELVFFADKGKLCHRHPMKEETFESFVKDTIASSTTSMILLFDRPKDETGFFRKAVGFKENFPLVILAASPSTDLNKQFTDNADGIVRYSSLMKLWSDDEFDDLIECEELPFIDGWESIVDDARMMYGNLPRLIFQDFGVKEFRNKLVNAFDWEPRTLAAAWSRCSNGELSYMAAGVSHHIMMLNPPTVKIMVNDFDDAPPFMTSYSIDELDEHLLKGHQDARVSMAYDLRLGRMFERLAFDYLQMKQLKATNLSGRKKILKIGPFKELETFDKASFGSIEPKSNKKTVWECAYEGWYAVDGFCDSCWLQMTVGSSHPITIAKTTKKNFMGFQDQYNRMKGLPKPKGKKRIVSKMTGFNDFVFVLPDFRENDFVKPQSFCNSGGTVDCPNWLKIRQYTAFIKRSDLL